jgi:ribosomal subunit interface protein
MKIDVRFRALDPSEALRAHVVRRVRFQLDRFGHEITSVQVRLSDVNGPRGGVDSRCSITLHMRDGRHIEVEAMTAWPSASITLAAKRLNEVLRRGIEKAEQSMRRRHRSTFAAPGGT